MRRRKLFIEYIGATNPTKGVGHVLSVLIITAWTRPPRWDPTQGPGGRDPAPSHKPVIVHRKVRRHGCVHLWQK